jgi:hypothetical protein
MFDHKDFVEYSAAGFGRDRRLVPRPKEQTKINGPAKPSPNCRGTVKIKRRVAGSREG